MNDVKVSENFRLREFECKHCQVVKLNSRLLEKLQKLRDLVGRPVIINSGYRCSVHNKKVGGVANSYHLKGMAADIRVTGLSPHSVATAAQKVGFSKIITYSNFVHVDVR